MLKRSIIVLIVSFSVAQLARGQVPSFREVPSEVGFWNPLVVGRRLSERDKCLNWRWPTPDEVKAKAPKDAEAAEKAKQEAAYWLRALTNETLVPDDVQDRMLLLDEDVDRVVARYAVDDLAIYWLQTRRSLILLVQRIGAPRLSDPKDMGTLVEELAQKLFVGPPGPVPSLSVPPEFIRQMPYGAQVMVAPGRVTFYTRPQDGRIFNHPDSSLPYAFWWGLIAQTDGQTVQFELMKRLKEPDIMEMRGGPVLFIKPGTPIVESWFSSEPDTKGERVVGPVAPGAQP